MDEGEPTDRIVVGSFFFILYLVSRCRGHCLSLLVLLALALAVSIGYSGVQ